MARIGSWIAFLFFVATFARADEVTVSATVDRNHMRPGDSFTYSISITSEGSASFDKPKLPDLSGFEVLSSWSGSEMRGTFVNGQVQTQRSQTFNYMLAPTQAGVFTIGASEVVVDGRTLRTNPIQITVDNSAPQAPSRTQAEPDSDEAPPADEVDQMEEDLFSQLLRRRLNPRGKMAAPVDFRDAFFIHVETDKKKVYQGEQVVASWYLVTKAQIADIDTLKYPTLSGFWKEDIEVATRLNFQPEIINGVRYLKALLASYALFPIKPGRAVIDPYKAKCKVLSMVGFGFPQEHNITKESAPIEIEVLPLPEAGKTPDFSGGVGEFAVTGHVDTTTVKANSPVTFKVRIEGRGNAKVVDFPKLNLAASVQVYDTKSEMKFFPNGRSYKEFETLLVPSEAGELKIPALLFTFFDPERKSYYNQSTKELIVRIEPGDKTNIIPSEQMPNAELAETVRKPVLPGLLLSADTSSWGSLASQRILWGIVLAFTFAGLGFLSYRELGTHETREDLRRQIRRRVQEIGVLVSKGDWRSVGVEATNLVYSVLGEIASLGGGSFELSAIIEKAPPSFKRDLAPQIEALMSKLQIVGFAPESVVGTFRERKELQKLIKETETLLVEAAKYDFKSSEGEAAG